MFRLYSRLAVAAVLIAVFAALCWLILPRIGVTMPWWVPVIGFVVIVLSAIFAPSPGDNTEDPDAPIPFRPIEDEGDGVSAADKERFG